MSHLFGSKLFQWDDEQLLQDLVPTIQSTRISYRPLTSMLTGPISLLSCDQVESVIAFFGLGGKWTAVTAKKNDPLAKRTYSVQLAAIGMDGAPLYLFHEGELVAEAKTGPEGKVLFDLPTQVPVTGEWMVSLFKEAPSPLGYPPGTTDTFLFTVWQVICLVRNKSDIWWRFAGRSINEELPRSFWSASGDKKFLAHTIGLAAPYGEQRFIDIAPIFGDMQVTMEYGVSAYCNTTNGRPTPEECLAARLNTWWEFKIVAFNGLEKHTVQGDLNIDRHLKITLDSKTLTGSIIKPKGAQT